MRVWVLIDLVYDDPENPGARVYATEEAAKAAEAKAIANNGNDDSYITAIVETMIE